MDGRLDAAENDDEILAFGNERRSHRRQEVQIGIARTMDAERRLNEILVVVTASDGFLDNSGNIDHLFARARTEIEVGDDVGRRQPRHGGA